MDVSENPQPDHPTPGHDAGAILGLLAQARQERERPVLQGDRPVERQVLAPAWGSWCWLWAAGPPHAQRPHPPSAISTSPRSSPA